jgi:uncharacterized RDD family membrane protein YckC
VSERVLSAYPDGVSDETTARPGDVAPQPPLAPAQSHWGPLPDQTRRPGPAPGFEYAGFWIRLVAFLIDLIPQLLIGAIVFLPVFAAFGQAMSDLPIPPPGTPVDSAEYEAFQRALEARLTQAMEPLYPVSGLLQLLSVVYYVGFWTWRGQTPGMMLLGLRVARESDGSNPGLARSILRYVGYVISQIFLFIGFIWVAFDSRKQGWHDKIAGTVVVRRSG